MSPSDVDENSKRRMSVALAKTGHFTSNWLEKINSATMGA